MGMLEDIKLYILDNGINSRITIDTMLDSPDECVGILEYAGDAGMRQIPGVVRNIQINARAASTVAAKQLCWDVYKAVLKEEDAIHLPDRWMVITPKQTPFKMKVDEKGRTTYVFNADVITHND